MTSFLNDQINTSKYLGEILRIFSFDIILMSDPGVKLPNFLLFASQTNAISFEDNLHKFKTMLPFVEAP